MVISTAFRAIYLTIKNVVCSSTYYHIKIGADSVFLFSWLTNNGTVQVLPLTFIITKPVANILTWPRECWATDDNTSLSCCLTSSPVNPQTIPGFYSRIHTGNVYKFVHFLIKYTSHNMKHYKQGRMFSFSCLASSFSTEILN